MLKNARKWQQEEKGGGNQEEKENVSRANNKPEKKGPARGRAKGRKGAQEEVEVAEENDDTTPMSKNEEQENEKQEEGGPKKFKFLKRKTKAMANQKVIIRQELFLIKIFFSWIGIRCQAELIAGAERRLKKAQKRVLSVLLHLKENRLCQQLLMLILRL